MECFSAPRREWTECHGENDVLTTFWHVPIVWIIRAHFSECRRTLKVCRGDTDEKLIIGKGDQLEEYPQKESSMTFMWYVAIRPWAEESALYEETIRFLPFFYFTFLLHWLLMHKDIKQVDFGLPRVSCQNTVLYSEEKLGDFTAFVWHPQGAKRNDMGGM